MPERPLVLFAAPTVADKERRHGGAPKYYFPSHSRQVSRLTPQFNVLQNTMNSGSIYFTNYATGVDPEYTLVFETVGDPHDFYKAVDKLKETYPTVEWLMELSDSNLDNSDDFYVMNSQSVRDDSKKLTTKLFCIMTNQVALSEIISLWKHYQTDENFKFPRGMTGFKQLFRTLYDVHKWGIQERLEDTGLTEIWKEELQDASLEKVKVQIELFFRSSISKRQEVEDNIKNIVIQVGGEIFSCSVIPEIEYHAILAAVPREYAQKIIDREEVALVIAEPIMFLKPCVQAIFSSDNNNFSDSNSFSVPTNVIEDPIIAMFDGAPQANHPLLKGMLTVDDPDGFESFYEVRERVHGTSMACYAVLDEIFMKETGMGVPNEYVAVLIKAMLAHGASWNGWDKMFQGVLNISGTNAKNALHRYLGYGEPDVDKVKECTKEQVTLIGFGDIAQDKAFIYSIPIPIEFHEKRLKRKLTVTLAYLSPIHPSSIKYREKQVWMTINNGNSLIGSRVEYDYHAVQRGTLQHEIFENNSIEVWDIDESIELKINCRGCASENNPEMLIPYALFATFEMAPDCGVEVYQKVVTKVQTKNAIKTM